MKHILVVVWSIAVFISGGAIAADDSGKFAAKGAARKSCSDFTQSAQQKNSDYLLYGGWLEGYVTSYNQFQPSNYDVVPWQTTELLLALLQRHCKANPDIKYLDAVNSLIKTVFPIRLEKESPLVKVSVADKNSYYYVEILQRAKQRLKFLGYYNTAVDGSVFTPLDVEVFVKYQKDLGIPQTGIPDQFTLSNLFLKKTQ
ncbi:peptidoglycan-binding domain-containing protein [Agarivorans aestuarii]|uniref:Peptidoglycan-binding domain-containing protein n=1 Tax=Agarivorans aestuarii TaxID=1563703 RepID=A0ABU7FZK9_9ALTE|nr:peptidoglycan-binding domain-containing protein [Agarivorans aestuarii]MEE1672597.1 peptidoglycan-binding domain-containing protein [Agarivorans aestuarii]